MAPTRKRNGASPPQRHPVTILGPLSGNGLSRPRPGGALRETSGVLGIGQRLSKLCNPQMGWVRLLQQRPLRSLCDKVRTFFAPSPPHRAEYTAAQSCDQELLQRAIESAKEQALKAENNDLQKELLIKTASSKRYEQALFKERTARREFARKAAAREDALRERVRAEKRRADYHEAILEAAIAQTRAEVLASLSNVSTPNPASHVTPVTTIEARGKKRCAPPLPEEPEVEEFSYGLKLRGGKRLKLTPSSHISPAPPADLSASDGGSGESSDDDEDDDEDQGGPGEDQGPERQVAPRRTQEEPAPSSNSASNENEKAENAPAASTAAETQALREFVQEEATPVETAAVREFSEETSEERPLADVGAEHVSTGATAGEGFEQAEQTAEEPSSDTPATQEPSFSEVSEVTLAASCATHQGASTDVSTVQTTTGDEAGANQNLQPSMIAQPVPEITLTPATPPTTPQVTISAAQDIDDTMEDVSGNSQPCSYVHEQDVPTYSLTMSPPATGQKISEPSFVPDQTSLSPPVHNKDAEQVSINSSMDVDTVQEDSDGADDDESMSDEDGSGSDVMEEDDTDAKMDDIHDSNDLEDGIGAIRGRSHPSAQVLGDENMTDAATLLQQMFVPYVSVLASNRDSHMGANDAQGVQDNNTLMTDVVATTSANDEESGLQKPQDLFILDTHGSTDLRNQFLGVQPSLAASGNQTFQSTDANSATVDQSGMQSSITQPQTQSQPPVAAPTTVTRNNTQLPSNIGDHDHRVNAEEMLSKFGALDMGFEQASVDNAPARRPATAPGVPALGGASTIQTPASATQTLATVPPSTATPIAAVLAPTPAAQASASSASAASAPTPSIAAGNMGGLVAASAAQNSQGQDTTDPMSQAMQALNLTQQDSTAEEDSPADPVDVDSLTQHFDSSLDMAHAPGHHDADDVKKSDGEANNDGSNANSGDNNVSSAHSTDNSNGNGSVSENSNDVSNCAIANGSNSDSNVGNNTDANNSIVAVDNRGNTNGVADNLVTGTTTDSNDMANSSNGNGDGGDFRDGNNASSSDQNASGPSGGGNTGDVAMNDGQQDGDADDEGGEGEGGEEDDDDDDDDDISSLNSEEQRAPHRDGSPSPDLSAPGPSQAGPSASGQGSTRKAKNKNSKKFSSGYSSELHYDAHPLDPQSDPEDIEVEEMWWWILRKRRRPECITKLMSGPGDLLDCIKAALRAGDLPPISRDGIYGYTWMDNRDDWTPIGADAFKLVDDYVSTHGADSLGFDSKETFDRSRGRLGPFTAQARLWLAFIAQETGLARTGPADALQYIFEENSDLIYPSD